MYMYIVYNIHMYQVVDLEALCIKGGVVAWHLRLDLKILDNGGNLADCAGIAGTLVHLLTQYPSTFTAEC